MTPGRLNAMQPSGCAQAACLACCLLVVATAVAGREMQTCIKQESFTWHCIRQMQIHLANMPSN